MERTIDEILARLSEQQDFSYSLAKDTSRTDMEREWFHGYADACHDLEMFIRKQGPFKP